MLDKVIHAHLDKMDVLEDDLSKSIEKTVSSIDIDLLYESPSEYLKEIVAQLKDLIIEEYAPRALDLGSEFAKTVDDLERDIIVERDKDPNINKEIVDDKS